MRKAAGAALVHLLDEECKALKAGDLSALAPIAVQKSQILIDLDNGKERTLDLATIRAKAARNETLLAAAIKGVKTARKRISELEAVKSDLRVYGKDGTLQNARRQSSAMERKA